MDQFEIKLGSDLSQKQKDECVALFIGGFKHMFRRTKGEENLQAVLMPHFNFSMIYACLDGDCVVGILGVGKLKKRPFEFDEALCQLLFGKLKGKFLYRQLNGNSDNTSPQWYKALYIDFLTTKSSIRGKGVASMLLEFACLIPGYEVAYLEVLSKNKEARHLYQKLGFSIYKKDYLSIMRLQGHGYPIQMLKDIK